MVCGNYLFLYHHSGHVYRCRYYGTYRYFGGKRPYIIHLAGNSNRFSSCGHIPFYILT